jgi:hypothetical protein
MKPRSPSSSSAGISPVGCPGTLSPSLTWSRLRVHGLTAIAVSAALAGLAAAAEIRRAKPPTKPWDKTTARAFQDDAFAELVGERPAFATLGSGGGRPGPTVPGPDGGKPNVGGFKWSSIVSEDTLVDEIKDLKKTAAAAVASASDFKGGGYDSAREAFSTAAVAFGVIAEYDQDIRWKKDAEQARDLFARVGFNCKVGTDQSFAESKLRATDLEGLLSGNSPSAKAEREGDFKWNQAAGRPPLMSRLDTSDGALGSGIASKADFEKAADRLAHEAEVVAMIGEVIQRPEFEYFDDSTYTGHASTMRDAALKVRDAARKKDYEAARAAVGEIKKACDACHGDYRS